jgi:hypothetical protein
MSLLQLGNWDMQETFLSRTNSILTGEPCARFALSNTDGFLSRGFLFHQLRCIGQFGTKSAFLHIENSYLQKIFLSKYNSILTGKQCVRCCSF